MKKEIKHKAILTVYGADKMNHRDIKVIQKWLVRISENLATQAYSKVCRFRLMK